MYLTFWHSQGATVDTITTTITVTIITMYATLSHFFICHA